jgi:hypothetical protein
VDTDGRYKSTLSPLSPPSLHPHLRFSPKCSFAVDHGLLYPLLEMNTWTKGVFAVFLVFPVFKISPRSCYEQDLCRKLTRKRVIDSCQNAVAIAAYVWVWSRVLA